MTRWKRHSAHITRGPRWRALRLEALRRDGFQCRDCGARGRLEVHHVKPVRTHPGLAYELDNLRCLCRACHTRITRAECGHPELSPERRAWREAVATLSGSSR